MKVIAFTGYSKSGKTTLMEQIIPQLKAQGQRVSVIKHAHHRFDIDYPGKDSFRHRQAGAFEVLVASKYRSALLREFEQETEQNVHHLIAQLYEGVDWVLVEGYRSSDLPKIEVWRSEIKEKPLFLQDDFIVAIATDAPQMLRQLALQEFGQETNRPVFDINRPADISAWMQQNAQRFDYDVEKYL